MWSQVYSKEETEAHLHAFGQKPEERKGNKEMAEGSGLGGGKALAGAL